MFGGNFAPVGWALCNGQLIPVNENEPLFALIGTTYGGDGVQTFALPNLQSRVPMHVGPNFLLGQLGGSETITLTTQQLPSHNHLMLSRTTPPIPQAAATPGNNFLADEVVAIATDPTPLAYAPFVADANQRTLAPNTLGQAGGNQPHDNMIPYIGITFIISLFGIFPSQG
jgi:microcystin-dependent protein